MKNHACTTFVQDSVTVAAHCRTGVVGHVEAAIGIWFGDRRQQVAQDLVGCEAGHEILKKLVPGDAIQVVVAKLVPQGKQAAAVSVTGDDAGSGVSLAFLFLIRVDDVDGMGVDDLGLRGLG